MGTLIKLKAEVNNTELPILGSDGKITDYYVGRLRNKIMELGGTVTDAEVNALTALIEDGKTNGWINKVAYFLPFIGNKSVPFAGAVPLIDNYGNWEMSEYANADEVTEDLFAYDSNNRIKSMGYQGSTSSAYLKTPVKASNLGNSIGTFASFTLYKVTDDQMSFTSLYNPNDVYITLRMYSFGQEYGLNCYYDEVTKQLENVNSVADGTNINFYATVFPQEDGGTTKGMFMHGWWVEGQTPSINNGPINWSAYNGITPPGANAKIDVGRRIGTALGKTFMPIKCLALITPDITKGEVIALNAAVNTFNTALGR